MANASLLSGVNVQEISEVFARERTKSEDGHLSFGKVLRRLARGLPFSGYTGVHYILKMPTFQCPS